MLLNNNSVILPFTHVRSCPELSGNDIELLRNGDTNSLPYFCQIIKTKKTMLTQQTPIAFSGNIPKYYDSFLGPMFFEPFALDMANRVGKIAPMELLELASGTGRLTKLLPAVLSKDAHIIASDINPAMVNFGRSIIEGDNVEWQQVDAVSLPFPDATFDCITVTFGVMFYSDRVKAFKEAFRVLKPGGTFIFSAWDEIKNNPMANIVNSTLKHFFPVDTPAFYTVPFSYHDENLINDNLHEAGFKNVAMEIVKLTGYSKSNDSAAKGLIYGTPTITAIEERDGEIINDVMEHLKREIAARFGTQSLPVPLQARIVSCVK